MAILRGSALQYCPVSFASRVNGPLTHEG
jgi:hypothetical protein